MNARRDPPAVHLLTDRDIRQLADPGWLVEPIIPASGLVTVFGPPGVGKTFLALDLALSVAAGHPWADQPTQTGPVVYVVAEGAVGLRKRVPAWECDRGYDAVPHIRFVPHPIDLTSSEAAASFVDAVRDTVGGPPTLVVLDTLSRCFPGGDENSAKDLGGLIDHVEAIRRATGGTILLIHHTTKRGDVERGHSVLRGSCDTMISVEQKDGFLLVDCEKQRDAEPFQRLTLQLRAVEESCVLDRVAAGAQSGREVRCLELLRQTSAPQRATEWERQAGLPQTTFYRIVKRLVERGLVAQGDDGRYVLTPDGQGIFGHELSVRRGSAS